MGKQNRSVEQIIAAPSAYPGDVSSYYRETPESLLGEPDALQNNIAALLKSSIESGCTVQEAADAISALFAPDDPKEKVKTDG